MGKWQWFDDNKWINYSSALNKVFEARTGRFKADVDDERYVEVEDIKEIFKIFGELPEDFVGLCAMQHRKDNPNKVRLVRCLPDEPLFEEIVYIYDYVDGNDNDVYLKAGSHGCECVTRLNSAQIVIMDLVKNLDTKHRKVVKFCKANGIKIYPNKWITESIENDKKESAANDISRDYFKLLEQDSGDDDNDNGNNVAYSTTSEEYDDDDDDEENSDDYANVYGGKAAVVINPIDIKNSTYEGDLIYVTLNEKYKFQIHFDDSDDIKGIVTWIDLHNCQTRFKGTRNGNTLSLQETEFLRGSSFSELGDYELTIVSNNIIRGLIKGDNTTKVELTKVMPKKRLPVLDSMSFFEDKKKIKTEIKLSTVGEVEKVNGKPVLTFEINNGKYQIPMDQVGDDIEIQTDPLKSLFQTIPKKVEFYETDSGITYTNEDDENGSCRFALSFNEIE
ncbi:WWE domain-containing protein [Entamoeba marina]